MKNSHDQVEARLARLERENRRLKRFGLAGLAGLGGLALMSFAAPSLCEIVWAERFVLRDARNNTRVTLNAYGSDTPTIAFHDARGREIGSVGITPDGAFDLRVMENGKAVKATFSVDEEGALRLAKVVAPKRTEELAAQVSTKTEGVN